MTLIGSNYDQNADMYNFYFLNEESKSYSYMAVSNVFGARDMHYKVKNMSHQEFIALATQK